MTKKLWGIELVETKEYHPHPIEVPSASNELYKGMYLIRHGQSEANIASNAERNSAKYLDTKLTPHGVQQAIGLQKVVKDWDIQLVLVSPLSRTIQTACLAFEHKDVPLVAFPPIMEFYPGIPENTGRNLSQLKKDPILTSLKRFKDINFDSVTDNWWDICGDFRRLHQFLSWFRISPHSKVAIVAHWGFIISLTDLAGNRERLQVDNCTWISTLWRISDPHTFGSLSLISTEAAVEIQREYGVGLLPSGNKSKNAVLNDIISLYTSCKDMPKGLDWNGLFHISIVKWTALKESDLPHMFGSLYQVAQNILKRRGAWHVARDAINVEVVKNPLRINVVFQSQSLQQLSRTLEDLPYLKDQYRSRDKFVVPIVSNKFTPEVLQQSNIDSLQYMNKIMQGNYEEFCDGFCDIKWDLCIVSRLTNVEVPKDQTKSIETGFRIDCVVPLQYSPQ